jgi:hypothetical protein
MLCISPLPRSVYLLGDGMLFDEIIANMLTSVANLRVIKRVYDGESAFMTDVSGCRPDVILLTETDRYDSEEMLTLLSRMPLSDDLRIIVLSMKHENVQILDRPARWQHHRAGVSHTLLDMDDWDELFDLVTGKRFCTVDIQ